MSVRRCSTKWCCTGSTRSRACGASTPHDRARLFGTVRLVRNWGRIGTNGQEKVEVFASEIEAGKALEVVARAKRRRGYQDL